ncbi:hypothetical protein A2801_02565 [Candidatus Woesebacteria bacterium RIFCSPHIGHO2_01_FULL_41_10]|uniref:Uncharacterized protein n=1 Tax=Candidatus Woesebacteria bacterium RIFCSPHIGHO2_01_FULL_41_10 TaxID=1802500 RepID=A0A1F7YM66_9BACT|nr:MAG: hypothetical protein A2801_02565 [Candidatus Woesebacteria bacterium RIFCSPHIGHO2_01_FULL_41_10]
MKAVISIVVILVIGYFVYNQFIKYPYRFVGYFYPNIENMDKWVESKPLGSVDECREWADEMADEYGVASSGNFDYECGKDCYKADPYNQGVTYTCHTSVD